MLNYIAQLFWDNRTIIGEIVSSLLAYWFGRLHQRRITRGVTDQATIPKS